MENKFNKINSTLDRFYDLQANHIKSFNSASLPDMEKQSMEQNKEIVKILESIDAFIKMLSGTEEPGAESMLISLNHRITNILEQNEVLVTRVTVFKENLKSNMKKISKGKQAIGSYRSSAAASNNPKVLSVTN
jgi:hypothetical protein